MTFKTIIISIVILLSLYFVARLWVQSNNFKSGAKAPNIDATLIDGSSYQLKDSKGKFVLLNFWGSWCPPCRKEIPHLVNFYKKYKDRVDIVTIALEKSDNNWRKIAEKAGFDWEYQIVEISRLVMMSATARKYGVTDIPAKFLITPEGNLLTGLSFDEMSKILNESNR